MSWFRREPVHVTLGRVLNPTEDRRAPWNAVGVHGLQRPREWDEVRTVDAKLPGDRAEFVVLEDAIVIDSGPDDVSVLVDALTLDPPYRAEAVKRDEGVWAVAAKRIDVVHLPGVEGNEIELTQVRGERTLVVDGARGFGSIPSLEREGDFALHARRLDGDLFEVRVDQI
ncbi:MAG: hypothetical protein ACYDA3_10965 [Gaiellaceae bacterium]